MHHEVRSPVLEVTLSQNSCEILIHRFEVMHRRSLVGVAVELLVDEGGGFLANFWTQVQERPRVCLVERRAQVYGTVG